MFKSKKPKLPKTPRKPALLFASSPVERWFKPQNRRPFVSYGLVATNFVVFIACCLIFKNLGFGFNMTETIRMGANWAPMTLNGEGWRLLSSCFLHANWMHIGFNMISLLVVGLLCENLYGRMRMLGIYLVSGVFASTSSILGMFANNAVSARLGLNTSIATSLGASGAILGLIGAYIAAVWVHRKDFEDGAFKKITGEYIRFLVFLIILGIPMHLDQFAHLGGLLIGFVLGLSLLPGGQDFSFGRKDVIAFSAAIFVTLSIFAIESTGVLDEQHMLPVGEALAFVMDRKFPEAAASLEKCLKAHPDNRKAREMLAICYTQTGQVEKSLQMMFEEDKAGKPTMTNYRFETQNLYALGRKKEAIETNKKALKLGGPNEELQRFNDITEFEVQWDAANYDQAQKAARHCYETATEGKDKYYAAIWYAMAARRAHGKNPNELLTTAKTLEIKNEWLDSVTDFELGELDSQTLLKRAVDNDNLTEGNAYVAFMDADNGHVKDAVSKLNWVVAHGNKKFFEYKFAKAELKRLSLKLNSKKESASR